MDKLRKDADSVEGLIQSFGNKCFKTEPTAQERYKASHQFCLTAFGDLDRLFRKGPKSTFEKMVHNLALYKRLPKTEFQFKFGRYRVGRKLGEGATATVFFGETDDGLRVALKVFKPTHTVLNLARKEYQALKDLKHKNIIKMVEFFEGAVWQMQPKARDEKPRKVYTSVLIMEYAARGELVTNLISMGGEFEPGLARWAFKGILSALSYCHDRDLAHCDIKLGNCFVTGDEVDKTSKCLVGDFGFVTKMGPSDKQQRNYGTPKFYAPEMHLNMPWTRNVDLFSLGILLFVLLHGKHPFEKAVETDSWYRKVVHKKWDRFWNAHHKKSQGPKVPLTDDAKDLLKGMLAYQPKDRFSLDKIRNHPWVTNERETFTDQQAYNTLTHRKYKKDAVAIKHAANSKENRDVAPWDDDLDVPAPLYHENIPTASKNWFYTKDSPRVALLWLSDIIKSKFSGWTDCDTPLSEWNAWLAKRKKEDKDAEASAAPSSAPTDVPAPSGIKPSVLKMAADSEKKAEAAAAAPTAEMELVPFGSTVISPKDWATCEGRMYNGIFELNFSLTSSRKDKDGTVSEIKHGGLVQVFACPANTKLSIVTFVSTTDPKAGNWDIGVDEAKKAVEAVQAATGDAPPVAEETLAEDTGKGMRQDLEVFSRIYDKILEQGGNQLIIDTRETVKELEALAKKAVPDLSAFTLDDD